MDKHRLRRTRLLPQRSLFSSTYRLYSAACSAPPTDYTALPVQPRPPILQRCLFSPAHRLYSAACSAPPTDPTALPVQPRPPIIQHCLFSPAHRLYSAACSKLCCIAFLLIPMLEKRELTLFLMKIQTRQ